MDWSLRDVSAAGDGRALFIAGKDSETNNDTPISYALYWNNKWSIQEIPFISNAICAPLYGEHALIVGIFGHSFVWKLDGNTEGKIDSSNEGPQHFGDITSVRMIGSHRFIVGMARTVYKEKRLNEWLRIDEGVRQEFDVQDKNFFPGFTSIHGFNEGDIYAVGESGEIFHFDGKNWKKVESPTNLSLERVVCGSNGMVYACGINGVIVEGRGHYWKCVINNQTRKTLWGATFFNGYPYFSGKDGIFSIVDDNLVQVLSKDVLGATGMTYYRLSSDETYIWSCGRRAIQYSQDGNRWFSLALPEF